MANRVRARASSLLFDCDRLSHPLMHQAVDHNHLEVCFSEKASLLAKDHDGSVRLKATSTAANVSTDGCTSNRSGSHSTFPHEMCSP